MDGVSRGRLRAALAYTLALLLVFFFFQAEDGIRDYKVTGVRTCALPIFQPFSHAATFASTWAANASWISIRSMSLSPRPTRSSNRGTAMAGAISSPSLG